MLDQFVISALIAFASAVLVLLAGKPLLKFHKFLAYTFIFEGILLLLAEVVFTRLPEYSLPICLLFAAMLLLSPFFYYYAFRNLLVETPVRKRDFWMLITAVAYVVVYLVIVSCIPSADRNAFFRVATGSAPMPRNPGTGISIMLRLDSLAYIFFIAEELFIQIFCIAGLFRYGRALATYHSNLEGKSKLQIDIIVVLLALRFAVCFIFSIFPSLAGSVWFRAVLAAVFSLFYVLTAVFACRVKYTAEDLGRLLSRPQAVPEPEPQPSAPEAAEVPAPKAAPSEPIANDVIASRLGKMVEQKFFLDPDINLLDMADKIQVNRKYIADYLHYHFGETFLTYVNRLRVEYSLQLLDSGNVSVNEAAEQSGFVNISTYYRNFIKVKGFPPSQYKKM